MLISHTNIDVLTFKTHTQTYMHIHMLAHTYPYTAMQQGTHMYKYAKHLYKTGHTQMPIYIQTLSHMHTCMHTLSSS